MTYDSTALSLSHDEKSALNLLSVAASTISQVGELRSTNDELRSNARHDADIIANLTDQRNGLEEALADVRQQLSDALAREAQLRNDLASVTTDLVNEQRLASQHWDSLTDVCVKLSHTEYDLAVTTIARDDATIALAEANDKLGKFRDILGIPHPVEPAPVVEPTPVEPTPSVVMVDTPAPAMVSNVVDLPNPFQKEAAPDGTSPLGFGSGSGWL